MASLSKVSTAHGTVTVRVYADVSLSDSLTRIVIAVMSLNQVMHLEVVGSSLFEM